MHTTEKLPSSRNKRKLPPGCALPQLKTLFKDLATRGAGQALYEILGIAELTRVAYEKGELESVQHRLEVLLSEAADLSYTISNIIELSRLETQSIHPANIHFNIVSLLQEVAQRTRESIGEKPLVVMDVSSPNPVVILSDPAKIRQIMTVLATNAAKFTDRGRIALILNKDEDRIRLMVTDTGRGMTSEEIAAVFDTVDREYDGQTPGYTESGLGLRIVKHLLRSLNGSLSVSSRVGEGTIVEVSLPLLKGLQTNAVTNTSGGSGAGVIEPRAFRIVSNRTEVITHE